MSLVAQPKSKPLTPAKSSGESSQSKKSGMKKLKAGEVLFQEAESATSLFIIQKGQLRLFRPKGKGFVELAVLRSGEVLGEMAYFAEESREKGRSCSAQAITESEIIEISFEAFGKTIDKLNPWFKTIISTLVSRLRKSNIKIKELETNSVAVGYKTNNSEYSFFRNVEVIKLLSTFFLVVKSLGQSNGKTMLIAKSTLKYYMLDVYSFFEVKFEEFIKLLESLGLLSLENDKNGSNGQLCFPNIDELKYLLNFLTSQRILRDDKKMKVSYRCELFLDTLYNEQWNKSLPPETMVPINISSILEKLKIKCPQICMDDLLPLVTYRILEDIVVNAEGEYESKFHPLSLEKHYYSLKLLNSIERINLEKIKL